MFDTFGDRTQETGGGLEHSENSSPNPAGTFFFSGVGTTDRRPDAVSTFLICSDRIELYGVQQLSGAVAPLEEKQKRYGGS